MTGGGSARCARHPPAAAAGPWIVTEMSHTTAGELVHDAGASDRPPRRPQPPGLPAGSRDIARGGPEQRRDDMSDIVFMGLVAIAVVVVMAGLLGWLVDRDDISAPAEG